MRFWKKTEDCWRLFKTSGLQVQRSRFEGRSFQKQVTSAAAALTCSVCFYILVSGYHNILIRSQKRDFSVPYTKTICYGTAARGHVNCSK
jgi:hypothetical protein